MSCCCAKAIKVAYSSRSPGDGDGSDGERRDHELGRLADAARIHGFVTAELARTGALVSMEGLSPVRERLDALLTGGLTPQELARYKTAGATMREGDVFELACGGDA